MVDARSDVQLTTALISLSGLAEPAELGDTRFIDQHSSLESQWG